MKTMSKKKKCKKTKWLSEEALQIAEKKREVKGKGKKERYTHLNAEFQRIMRRNRRKQQIRKRLVISSGEGNGTPLQYSCLENPRDGQPGGLPSMGSHRVGHD